MFPPGLKGPQPSDFRDALPSDARPANYPSRLPFVVNQAMSYAESEDLASCIWPALSVGERPVAEAKRTPRPPGFRGAVTGVLDAIDTAVDFLKPDPATKAILDDLFERVLAAAAQSGWTLKMSAPAPFPPGSRHATLTRPGERMEIMGVLTPFESAVTASSFADSAA
jgi:hypothetical protein